MCKDSVSNYSMFLGRFETCRQGRNGGHALCKKIVQKLSRTTMGPNAANLLNKLARHPGRVSQLVCEVAPRPHIRKLNDKAQQLNKTQHGVSGETEARRRIYLSYERCLSAHRDYDSQIGMGAATFAKSASRDPSGQPRPEKRVRSRSQRFSVASQTSASVEVRSR